MNSASQNRMGFLGWLKYRHPALYGAVMPIVASRVSGNRQLGGFFDSLTSGISTVITKVSEVLPNLADKYLQTKEQIDLVKLNLERAKAGLPSYDSLAQAATETQTRQTSAPSGNGFSMSSVPWYVWAVLGVGVASLLLRRRR